MEKHKCWEQKNHSGLLRIEAWNENILRIRYTKKDSFLPFAWALDQVQAVPSKGHLEALVQKKEHVQFRGTEVKGKFGLGDLCVDPSMNRLSLAILVILLGLLGPLFSCSRSKSLEKNGGKTELEFWHIQTNGEIPQVIQESVDRYTAEHPQYRVNVVPTANDSYKQKLTIAMASDKIPDIFPSWSGGPMIEYVNSGLIADLTDQMNKKNSYKNRFLDAAIDQASYQGRIYGVPVENVAVSGVFYNKKLFDQYKIVIPQTVEELEAIAEKFVAIGIFPFALANKTQWPGSMYYMNLATRYGGLEPFREAVSGEGSFEAPAFVYAGEKIQEWVEKGYFNLGFNGLDEDSGQTRQLLYTGQAAMTMMGSWYVSIIKDENPEFFQNLGVFKFPSIKDSSADQDIVIGTVGDNFYHVSASSPDTSGAFGVVFSLLDEQAVKKRLQLGRIVPLKGIVLKEPLLQQIMGFINQAPGVQLWYDQYLPPALGELHKSTLQEVFGGTMSPGDANRKMQEAMKAYNSKG